MKLETVEQGARRAGTVAAFAAFGVVLRGISQGLGRPSGRTTGMAQYVLRGPVYLLVSVGFFGLCYALWKPIQLTLSLPARVAALVLGILLYFPGLAFAAWGRYSLGAMYNVSSGLGVRLYADHRLITHGPYAIVRHPIYLGASIASLGGLLLYRTWTPLMCFVMCFGLSIRARREEQALAAEFGAQWIAYCRRVPAWIPRLRPRSQVE